MSTAAASRVTIVGGEGAWIEPIRAFVCWTRRGLWHANTVTLASRCGGRAAKMRKIETYHTSGTFVNDEAIALADRVAAPARSTTQRVLRLRRLERDDTAAKPARRFWQLQGRPTADQ